MADHVPNPTDVVGTVDTTGINPGPHNSVEGVSPIFEIAKDTNEKPIEEHFAEMALAAGTEEYQENNPVSPEPYESNPFPPADETADTSDTGGRAPGDTINQDLPAMTSTDQVGADHTSGTVTGDPADGEQPSTTGVDGSNPAASDETGSVDVGSGPLAERKVTQLNALADRENVDLGGATKKADIVDALQAAGVTDDA